MENQNLAKKYIAYCDAGMPDGNTWDDFFDHCEIPKEARNSFAMAAILKQAQEIIKKE